MVLSEAVSTKPCLQSIWNKIKDNKPLTERLLGRSTVASATFLQSIDNPNEILIVANTHLYFHPDADHIRLIQGGIVIYWLMDIKNNMISKVRKKFEFCTAQTCSTFRIICDFRVILLKICAQ